MRQSKKDERDALCAAPDSLSFADLAHYISSADNRRRACDQVMARLRDLVAEVDADTESYLQRRGRALRPRQ